MPYQITEMITFDFRPLAFADLPLVHEWLGRPHVAEWWSEQPSLDEMSVEFAEHLDAAHSTQSYLAYMNDEPIGFIQSYVVVDSDPGWWDDETDPGARGIDQFLGSAYQLGQGIGSAMVRAFVDGLFRDPAVTKVQTDPDVRNERAIRAYRRAGFREVGEALTPDGASLLMVRMRCVWQSTLVT